MAGGWKSFLGVIDWITGSVPVAVGAGVIHQFDVNVIQLRTADVNVIQLESWDVRA